MDLTRDPSAIANTAADEVRTLNHRTDNATAFEQPSDVSDVVNALEHLLQMLPQSLRQAINGLNRFEERQAIRMDDGTDVAYQVERVRQETQAAITHAREAHRALKRAASPLSHMGGPWANDD